MVSKLLPSIKCPDATLLDEKPEIKLQFANKLKQLAKQQ
jgi:hypothetical protein